MQLINNIRWLRDVVQDLGGTDPVVQTEDVDVGPVMQRKHISFQVPDRHAALTSLSPGQAIPMVAIAAWGSPSAYMVTVNRTVVEACLQQLNLHGYFVPDFSWFRMRCLEEEDNNVIITAKRLSPLHDMVWNILLSFFQL